jgi:hypothetical protein
MGGSGLGLAIAHRPLPSERYAVARGIRHKNLPGWAKQMLLQLAGWLPERRIVVVSDHSFAALNLLDAVHRHVWMISRLRLEARLSSSPTPSGSA